MWHSVLLVYLEGEAGVVRASAVEGLFRKVFLRTPRFRARGVSDRQAMGGLRALRISCRLSRGGDRVLITKRSRRDG